MSDDEIFALIISSVIALIGWGAWYRSFISVRQFVKTSEMKTLLWLWPIAMIVVMFGILRRYAADDVRNDPIYLSMYTIMGAAWIVLAMKSLAYLGISTRDDAIERNNSAAIPALIGTMTGIMLSYAGGNIGNGPSWLVVVFSSGLATLTIIITWIIINIIAASAERITVDRDVACGWRIGCVLACIGIVAGRGVIGDWVSCSATVRDFVDICKPVLPFVICVSFFEKFLFSKDDGSFAGVVIRGMAPCLVYISLTVLYLVHSGWYK
ncbi:MAG: hypothetical protein ABFD79_11945 [Phycisphaerales bacterium]